MRRKHGDRKTYCWVIRCMSLGFGSGLYVVFGEYGFELLASMDFEGNKVGA
jgi:hypothetical protein